jgi:hypothetical protein
VQNPEPDLNAIERRAEALPDLDELERLLSAMKTGTREDEDRLLRWVFFHAPALIAQAREAARLRDALVEIDILLAPQIDERDLEQAREVARAALDPNRSE